MELDELRRIGLFSGTEDDQLLALIAAGTEVRFESGEVLFQENHPAEFWWVLLDGSIDLVRHVRHEETRLGAMDVPGRWAGGFRAWDEHGAYLATGRATTAGRILRVPAGELRALWTTRFSLGLYLIEGVSRSARNYETMAREKESLAALGTLAAGLAHELNNPAAAATRAVDALGNAYDGMLSSLRRLAAAPITADQFARLDTLRQELGRRPAGDAMEIADRGYAVSEWLSRHRVPRGWVLAPTLVGAGADVDWCARVGEALGEARLEPGLEWVASTLSASGLLDEVKDSTHRISDLVAAVKSYSQLDRASMQQTDLAEGLESTLVMLAHRIPTDVTVVREYDPRVPRIQALAAELNQVWTNVIDNALDAMDGRGTLRVSTRLDRDEVVVEIGDTGAGMSPETEKHAFDPFYTTKGVGEGTGLGLDISRRIVDRHRGQISVQTAPGETVLRVRLPAVGAGAVPKQVGTPG
jgi:signal transduction histidine kinase